MLTNITKWLIAIPFSALIGLIIPALITGDLFWFVQRWSDLLYVTFSISMWLLATAFVDVSKPRSKPDRANRLISLGLILAVPVAVTDRAYLLGKILPVYVPMIGTAICAAAIILGVWARLILGQAYSPRGETGAGDQLVQSGPYKILRHPMYAAACLWAFFWPLLISSLIGAVFTGALIISAVHQRIEDEEAALVRTFGDAYREYRKTSWRLIPFVY